MQFTVFTPVYNRKHTLHRVWESLNAQTFRDFEWLIVNDGSKDGVESLLESYKAEASFPITIIHQANQGKHVAWNRGIQEANGVLTLIADSDDSFVPETLERFNEYWLSIPETERNGFSGVNVLCKSARTGLIVGDSYPQDRMVTNNLDITYRLRLKGEKWGCVRTDLLKQRPFPEVPGNFFGENYIWLHLARQYRVLCVNDPLRYYYEDEPDSLINNLMRNQKNAISQMHYFHWVIDNNADYIFRYEKPVEILKSYLKVWKHAFMTDTPIGEIIGMSKSGLTRLILLITLPAGWLFTRLKSS